MRNLIFPYVSFIINHNKDNYKYPHLIASQINKRDEEVKKYNNEVNIYNLLVLKECFTIMHYDKFTLACMINNSKKKNCTTFIHLV